MKVQSVVVLAVFSVIAAAAEKSPAQFYCGRRLALTIAMVCASESETEKRSQYGSMIGYERPYNGLQGYESALGWPWVPQHRAKEMSARGKRVMVGVADECCIKPCTLEELQSYC